ncbi:hypothetical protein MNEG_5392 [Monoraphidium neglectum]|uniref:Uncharacterized protein n=1 Tax=Monoraphidium neglectum TaxID=145388 RepID=A0A0D2JUQ6_9CHLO|nr:hypothetical protein MNEG_5392 [Monoraphidium neglectum]KIZ02568.1 hypothetical protein MNEG_5392 [Monoraphidium neglectum]|eukprot:XP_013901587.1 hypothetical protein MNEG_5392 [Monoraphidium neglectum]
MDGRALLMHATLHDAAAPDGYLLDAQHAKHDIRGKYEIKSVLGRGSYATARVAVEKGTGRHFACKTICKKGLSEDEQRRVRREVSVMYHLAGHPNVIKLEDAFEDDTYVHLVMELCSGGEMVQRILNKGAYTERGAAAIMRSILEAVAYAHDMGCMHRDIKIDNCMLLDASPDAPVKLVDWGFSSFVQPGKKLHKLCGTIAYLAPEVVAGSYDERADVWSCGVVLYAMLAGRLPFNGSTQEEVLNIIKSDTKGVPDMSGSAWAAVSEAAKSAVRALMTRDPRRRPSAREALRLDWIRECGAAGDNPIDIEPEVLHRMKDFAGMAKLKRHAAMVIAKQLPADQVLGLKLLFESMDRDGGGAVTARGLRDALGRRGCPKVARAELEDLLAHADLHGTARLDFAEFVAAALHHSVLADESYVRLAFDHFDRDRDGRISAAELAAALAEDGEAAGAAEAEGMLAEADEDGDGRVDYKEFKHMMRRGGCTDAAAGAGGPVLALGRAGSEGYYDLY